MTTGEVMADIAAARIFLQHAHEDLDDAVRTLPDLDADNAMATPVLMAILNRVSTAKGQLKGLEHILASRAGTGLA